MKQIMLLPLVCCTIIANAARADEERQIDELRQRAVEHRERADTLDRSGDSDAARGHLEQAERFSREADELAERRRDRREGHEPPNMQRLMRELEELSVRFEPEHPRLVELRRRIRDLHGAREHEGRAAEHAEREAHARAEHERRQAEHRDREQLARDRAEQERRLHHLHVAVENLHAAGLHELAQRAAAEAGDLEARLHEHRPPAHHPGPQHHVEERLEHLQRQIEELRDVVQQLAEVHDDDNEEKDED